MPQVQFRLFGAVHLAILAAVFLGAAALAWPARRNRVTAQRIRLGLGWAMAVNLAAWYLHQTVTGGFRFPLYMPLQLCDVASWLAIAAAFTLHPLVYETAYYIAIAGGGMALLTPDLWAPLCAYPSIRFFVEHGLAVMTVLYLAWSRLARPRPGSVWRTWLAIHVYAAAIGAYNAAFHTNYFYICRKPAQFSVLDWLGPWPWYIAAGDLLALILFGLLWLPFRPRGSPALRSP